MIQIFLLSAALFSLAGCLLTRTDVAEVEQKKQMQDQVSTLQKTYADSQNRTQEVVELLRDHNGRLEALEAQRSQLNKERDDNLKRQELVAAENTRRVQALQEEVALLRSELEQLKDRAKSAPSVASNVSSLHEADEAFQAKEWRRAAILYQKFREKNAKNKLYPEATYKLAVALVEQGMKEEAAVFFDEVIKKFPGTPNAKKAQAALKKLK